MSALSFARQAFGREKPHSSITDWVDILTSSSIEEEAYDGIPELVDSINLQGAGPAEASRALRKKLKHGNTHQQYRALVILKALVENGGQKFQSTFADGQLTDALKNIAFDSNADKRVKKKLILVLGSWRDQFKSDPSMALVAGLYQQCRGDGKRVGQQELAHMMGLSLTAEEKKRYEKEDAKKKAKKDRGERERAERRLKEEEDRKRKKRVPFDFEKEKPKVLASIVDGSQASSNLVNAITLVNLATDSLQTNETVQDCLTIAKQVRKLVVRYIQLVENENIIGTLIETNDRLMTALEMYDKLSTSDPDNIKPVTTALAAASLGSPMDELLSRTNQEEGGDKGKDRNLNAPHVHPDLEDLNFGPLGNSSTNLPPPLRPSTLSDDEQDNHEHRASLSDFSDYESSDEETHRATAGSSSKRNYVTVSDSDDEGGPAFVAVDVKTRSQPRDDPFADPFADDEEVHAKR
ncbi:hypothetical protein B0H34DRAFT_682695 [Crassisporium funariophilum]|nr:hypothetical protein B0H34DRAFT_682695 [Crassisporium funariophilum]